jgi:hypothetical protein
MSTSAVTRARRAHIPVDDSPVSFVDFQSRLRFVTDPPPPFLPMYHSVVAHSRACLCSTLLQGAPLLTLRGIADRAGLNSCPDAGLVGGLSAHFGKIDGDLPARLRALMLVVIFVGCQLGGLLTHDPHRSFRV